MDGFISLPLNGYVAFIVLVALLVALSLAMMRVEDALKRRIAPGRKRVLVTGGVALGLILIVFGSLAFGLSSWKNHNTAWTQQAVVEKYGLGLSDEFHGESTFDPINDYGNDYWDVTVLNNDMEEFDMQLRFDSKSGEPILSFPDFPGVPKP